MDEPAAAAAASTTALDALRHVARAVWSVNWSRYSSWLLRLVVLPLRLVWAPLSYVARAALVLLSPLLYVLSYVLACFGAIASFLASLEPLYTFFGAAAAVGIVAGITLGISSTIITSYAGMQDDQHDAGPPDRPDSKKAYLQYSTAFHDGSSSNESTWHWDSHSRRRAASGLLSQTIHEEDDDSDM